MGQIVQLTAEYCHQVPKEGMTRVGMTLADTTWVGINWAGITGVVRPRVGVGGMNGAGNDWGRHN